MSAVAGFVSSTETPVPLTISVEGDWGSGKSSFMLQLKNTVVAAGDGKHFVVDFNAWRYQKDEALWAAFALNFVKKLRPQLPWQRVLRANAMLMWRRLDWDQGRFRILRTGALMLAILALGIFGVITAYNASNNGNIVPLPPAWVAWLAGGIATVVTAFASAAKLVGNPFEHDLKRYFDAPDYRGKRAFAETFDDDFTKIVKSYVRTDERVFVFIDDLDRTDIPRGADLLQALNLLLSGAGLPIVYVIGLDREIVSAGIAAKLEKQIPFLFPYASEPTAQNLVAFEFALSYVEKFVQVPFRLPTPDAAAVSRYVTTFSGVPPQEGTDDTTPPSTGPLPTDAVVISLRTDSKEIATLSELVAPLFENNPRRLKQFLNVFRLQAYIAHQTGLFEEQPSAAATLTLQKLAKVVAILLRYPRLATALRDRPTLLATLEDYATAKANPSPADWQQDHYTGDDFEMRRYTIEGPLITLLAHDSASPDCSIRDVDLRRILSTVPARTRTPNLRVPQPQPQTPPSDDPTPAAPGGATPQTPQAPDPTPSRGPIPPFTSEIPGSPEWQRRRQK